MIKYFETIPEWKSILFQILIMLITYQKVFSFTHNDLHTNNIMYKKPINQVPYTIVLMANITRFQHLEKYLK